MLSKIRFPNGEGHQTILTSFPFLHPFFQTPHENVRGCQIETSNILAVQSSIANLIPIDFHDLMQHFTIAPSFVMRLLNYVLSASVGSMIISLLMNIDEYYNEPIGRSFGNCDIYNTTITWLRKHDHMARYFPIFLVFGAKFQYFDNGE